MKFPHTKLQPLYKKIFSFAIRGLNYNNIDFESNGEKYFIETLKKKYAKTTSMVNIMDIGAHHGHYSKLLSKLFSKERIPHTIYAFEPFKNNFDILKKNTKFNKNIKCINLGVGIRDEKNTLYIPSQNSTLSSLYNRQIDLFTNLIEEEVNLVTIDSFIRKENIEKIHFLKIDVEGNELSVLQGAQCAMNKQLIQHIQFEFGGTALDANIHLKDFNTLFSKYQYQYGRLLTKGIQKYSEYHVNQELYAYANYIAWID